MAWRTASGSISWEAAIIKRFEHGGNVHTEAPPGGWLDFSANINPLGLSEMVYQALSAHLKDIVHYPDPAARELKAALANHYGVPLERLVLGNGATELFYLLMQTLRPKRVLVPVPSFSEYERSALAVGADVIFFTLEESCGFKLDFTKLFEQTLFKRPDVIILGSPNNPTGSLIHKDDMRGFISRLKSELGASRPWILVDESFLDFREDAEGYTVRRLNDERLVVIQSLTKFYAIPGLRLGFGLAAPHLIEQLEQGKDVWNVNSLAQTAGIAALGDEAYAQNTKAVVAQEANFLYNELSTIAFLSPHLPTVNFILCKVKKGSGASLANMLRQSGILIRDCSNYPGLSEGYVRLAVRGHDENLHLLKVLRKLEAQTW